MEFIINQLAQWISFVFDRLSQQLTFILGEIFTFLQNSQAVILDFLSGALNATLQNVNLWLDRITQAIAGFIDSAQNLLSSAIQQIVEVSVGVVDAIAASVSGLIDRVTGLVNSAIQSIANLVIDIGNSIRTTLNGVLSNVVSFAQSLAISFQQFLQPILNSISVAVDTLAAKISQSIDAILGASSSLIEGVNQRLTNLREAFADAATSLADRIIGEGSAILEPVKEMLKGEFDLLAIASDPAEVEQSLNAIQQITAGNASPAQLKEWVSTQWIQAVPTKGLWGRLAVIIASVVGVAMLLIDAGRVSSQVQLQQLALEFPWQVLQPVDAAVAWRRGFINRAEALDSIKRQGYSEGLSNIIIDMTAQFPDEDRLFRAWHRGLVNETFVDTALKARNHPEEWIEAAKQAAFPLPPIGDLITMAVREVFSPEVAERFGQFDDFPPAFEDEAARQGLTAEWAKRYWGAHWALPSPRQGFEMLHRGVIEQDDLNLLLRALDVMPFWRDKLTAIAFTPFTRVDIRRMHKIGTLTDEEVIRAYKDIGYDDDKAKRLQEFTIQLSTAANADDEVEVKNLSRSAILGFFADGLMTRSRAFELLSTIGYSDDAANLFLDSTELDEERRDRNEEVALTLELVKADILSIEQGEARLFELGLETTEVSKAIAKLTREQQRRTKLPTRTEAARFVKAGIITEDDYRSVLEALGYSDKWVDAFVAELGANTSGTA